jgi:hypothetical protein
MNKKKSMKSLRRQLLVAGLLGAVAHAAPAFEITHNAATYYDFFGAHPDLPTVASSVGALARDVESRKGILRDGDGKIVVDEQDPAPGDADFAGNSTTTPGVTVGMRSSVQGAVAIDPGSPSPVRAKADFFANHAFAATSRSFRFYADTNAGEFNDDGDNSNEFFLTTGEGGLAVSSWADTWTALEVATIGANYSFDGTVRLNDPCANAFCGVIFPSGTDAFEIRRPRFSFEAVFAVFDLNTILPCFEIAGDDCDGQSDAPMTAASISIRGGSDFDEDNDVVRNGDTLSIDLNGTLDFEIVEGHQYYLVSELQITSNDGTVVDFFNTLGLDSVTAPPGSFLSDAVQNQGATLNISAVPLPGAAWLMLTGIGVLAARRRG